ncbi:sulfotransferase family 2 domain-containing protein [Paracoccus aminovorans]|uniref:sulfotransferase family 2 domain-containing protein n=1 Tax=Paracoccus aminovorans TaxID=34004 RepID=UPI002B257319|nr:sulfotransferase family 2 domain-containing protein [Paracoccus aminovorans]
MTNRVIVFHYHLFKNAGTSLDRLLKDNFGNRWLTREFGLASQNNTPEVEGWISSTPDGIAYSTHTAMGPFPVVRDVTIIPIIFLRDPIERILSAYRFERKQQADTWGTRLAREHDLNGYVRARLARPNDRQCRNFYAHRLASLASSDGPELERATRGLSLLNSVGVVGRVESFDAALSRLSARLVSHFPDFSWRSTRANVSDRGDEDEISQDVLDLLRSTNQDDYQLLAKLEELQSV